VQIELNRRVTSIEVGSNEIDWLGPFHTAILESEIDRIRERMGAVSLHRELMNDSARLGESLRSAGLTPRNCVDMRHLLEKHLFGSFRIDL
jgi:hypothetical protein